MNHEGVGGAAEIATAEAIRAVEDQIASVRKAAPPDEQERRRQFFNVLDNSRDLIFQGITAASGAGKRKFYPGTIPGFNDQCDRIFGYGLGQFDVDLLNAWLYSRDLRHLFTGATKALEW